jgi:hypothetical protein
MVNYAESVEFVNSNANKLRAVIVSHSSCGACQLIIDLFNETTIPFVVLDSDSSDVVYQPVCYPETSLFSENNKCYTRADVYDLRMLNEWIELINTIENRV